MAHTNYYGEALTLSVDDITTVRRQLCRSEIGKLDFGGEIPLNVNMLESAAFRQQTSFGGRRKYQRPHELAATLFYGLATNHAYENGNKRTALVCMLVIINKNNRVLCNTSEGELYEMATSLVNGTFPIPRRKERTPDSEVSSLASWIRGRTKQMISGEQVVTFRKLRKLLAPYGATFDPPQNNYIKIRLDEYSVKTGYPSKHFEVSVGEMKRIRKALGLDYSDNREFYDLPTVVDDFVYAYRNVLYLLADA